MPSATNKTNCYLFVMLKVAATGALAGLAVFYSIPAKRSIYLTARVQLLMLTLMLT